jgi:hypothetical protein
MKAAVFIYPKRLSPGDPTEPTEAAADLGRTLIPHSPEASNDRR